MTQVAILGAGMAGLSTGWQLQKKGISFKILEKQPYIGGLARSFVWHGFHCDFATHRLFTTDEAILHELLKLTPMGRHIRRSKIYMRGHWLRDPLDTLELITHLPPTEQARVLWTYVTRNKKLNENSFENYVLKKYGKGLYEIFFRPYTEKLFGIPGDKISVLWARQKVRLANPLDALRENTKTKFQYFYYPVQGGFGAIPASLYNSIQESVETEATVCELVTEGKIITAVRYRKGEDVFQEPVDAVVSTLPLTLTGRMLGRSFHLQYQKVDSVYFLIDRPQATNYHWIYFMDDEIAINRLVEFKNLSAVNVPEDKTVLCAEVTQPHQNVIQKVTDDLIRVGIITEDEILDTLSIRDEFAYPVYDQHYDQTLDDAFQFLDQYQNLYVVGRAAEFQHRETDDNFAAAAKTVEQIMQSIPTENNRITHTMDQQGANVINKKAVVANSVYAVILAWNNYQDTEDCLESVTELDADNLEIVLVDNGSSDQTPAKVREKFPQVHVIENGQNLGVPAGYNVGFRYALQKGAEYILMLNNDTVLAPDMLTELLKIAKDDPSTGIVMPKVLYYGSDKDVWSSGGRYRIFPPAILMTENRESAANHLRLIEYAPSCALLIHQQAFELAGLFDPGYLFLYDDWDFSERVRAHGLNIWYAPNARVWHKVSRSTKGPTSPLFWKTMASSSVRFYRRHGRPVWFSLPVHIGYIFLREILWKRQWAYASYFFEGIREGLQKPLGEIPSIN